MADFVERRETRYALKLCAAYFPVETMLWLPCREPELLGLLPSGAAERIFVADYRERRLRAVTERLRETAPGQLRARAVDVPTLDWDEGAVDLAFLPGVLSRLAISADRRLLLARLAQITRRVLCVTARVSSTTARRSSVAVSGLGPERAVEEGALLEDFAAVGLAPILRRRVLRLSERRIWLLGRAGEVAGEGVESDTAPAQ
jgi:hypothetical protein